MKISNIKHIHKNDGIVKLIIDEEVVSEKLYLDFRMRKRIISDWENSVKRDFVIKIIPDWNSWNGKY